MGVAKAGGVALQPCACAVGLRRPQVRTRLCVPRPPFPSVGSVGSVTFLGQGNSRARLPRRRLGASVSGSRSRGACWDQEPGQGWALAVGSVQGGRPRSQHRCNTGARAGWLHLRCSHSRSCARRPRGLRAPWAILSVQCVPGDKRALLLSTQDPKRRALECNSSISF